ncbi:WD40 repeat domain-containing protein [Gimesia fumaroli]|uniref:WD domain, G-beta repeat n=1 Tax=Gimesia fumaroli TaxID=2527976 RepID=A0A518I8T0_9PLAN|nr:WD40 repeat domain-containing protein [Gimesia fumaroli]QDV49500.1 WD domain, G-beta repeat [Gimesia fumaroli]
MSGFEPMKSWKVCLVVLITIATTLQPVAATKPGAKTEPVEEPVLAVKPILIHGPTPLPAALKFAQLDAHKAAKQTAIKNKALDEAIQKLQRADEEIKGIQKRIQETKQKIKVDSDTLKQSQQALKKFNENKAREKKSKGPLIAAKPVPDIDQLRKQIAQSEKQVKSFEQAMKEKQKQQGELKKQAAEQEKQLAGLKAKESQFSEIAKLYQAKPPIADPKLIREIATFQNSRPLYSCKIDASGNYLLAGAQGSDFQRWDLVSAENTPLSGHKSWVRRFDIDDSKPLLITGAYEGKLAWWDLASDQPTPKHLIDAHKGFVRGVSLSPDGTLVATAGNDRLVKIWSVKTARLIRTLAGHEHQVYNVMFHPGGRYLISGDLRGNLKQWDVNTGELVRDFDGSAIYKYDKTFHAHIGGIRGMDISRDGKYFAISSIGEVSNAFAGIGVPTVILFDWETGKRLAVMTPSDNIKGTCWGVRFHPENDFIAAAGGNSSGMIWFWKLGEEKPYTAQKVKSVPYDLTFHPDGLRMCVACYDKTARLYSLGPKTPAELAKEKGKKKK